MNIIVTNPLRRMLAAIRGAQLSTIDREVLRIAFAQLDAGAQEIHLPERVIARVRDIHARMPK